MRGKLHPSTFLRTPTFPSFVQTMDATGRSQESCSIPSPVAFQQNLARRTPTASSVLPTLPPRQSEGEHDCKGSERIPIFLVLSPETQAELLAFPDFFFDVVVARKPGTARRKEKKISKNAPKYHPPLPNAAFISPTPRFAGADSSVFDALFLFGPPWTCRCFLEHREQRWIIRIRGGSGTPLRRVAGKKMEPGRKKKKQNKFFDKQAFAHTDPPKKLKCKMRRLSGGSAPIPP